MVAFWAAKVTIEPAAVATDQALAFQLHAGS